MNKLGFQFNVGLKLYSTDIDLIQEASELQKKGVFDFIELYIVPETYEKTIKGWRSLDYTFVIHAPHSAHGFNLAQVDKWEINYKKFSEVQLFADVLGADIIIVHGGNNGSFDETLRQMDFLDDKRIILENKPKIGINNEICVGWSPSEFQRAYDANILYGMALDFGHAVCAAISSSINVMAIINDFLKFNPKVFHLSDGDASSEKDIHLNLGKGNLDIRKFISFVPTGGFLTIETPHEPSRGLIDFIDSIHFLKSIV